MLPSNCSGCNASANNSTDPGIVDEGSDFGNAVNPLFNVHPGIAAAVAAAILAATTAFGIYCLGRKRGWRLWFARQPLIHTEDVQLTDLQNWMGADDGDVTIGGPLSRQRASNGQGMLASPSKETDTEYFDMATPRNR
mmetsp:Transcript_19825/g.55929  ORF Transcript_19825/g.55929 Transcript_19825/m.55929 type:complete len:138 (+) Transcript_19825:146-559(+)